MFLPIEKSWLGACACVALGEATAFLIGPFARIWPLIAFLTLLLILFGVGSRLKGWRVGALFCASFCVAAAMTTRQQDAIETMLQNTHRPFEFTCRIPERITCRPTKLGVAWYSFTLRQNEIPLRVHFSKASDETQPQPGQLWKFKGWVTAKPTRDGNYPLWIKGGKTSAEPLQETSSSWRTHLATIRSDLSHRMGLGLEHAPEIANLNRAILLGERNLISQREKELFVQSGTVHLFAISGLHVMLICQVIILALTLLCFPYRWIVLPLIPILSGYVLLTGASASAIRAASMAALYFLMVPFYRRPSAPIIWSLVFLALHLVAPFYLLDIGCQMSFIVVLALIYWGRLNDFKEHPLLSYLGFTLTAWAAGVPIAAHYFGTFTPGGLIANIFLIPAASWSVTTSILGILTSFISSSLAAHFNNLAASITELMTILARLVSSIPGMHIELEPWPVWTCFAWYALFAALLYGIHFYRVRRERRII